MIYFIAAYPCVLLQQLCVASCLRSMYTQCRLVLRTEENNIPCLSAVFFHFYASRFRIIIFSRPIMLNFCSFPANSRHNAALLPFDFACSVFVLIQRFICVFFLFIRIFSATLFRKPFSSFSASIAKSPFNRNYPETPCPPPTENRPNIPRNSDRFHPRAFS